MPNENGTNGFTPAQHRRLVTPTGRRLLDVLSDGRPHGYKELFAALDFPSGWAEAEYQAAKSSLQNHISDLRGAVAPKGLDIVCQLLHKTKKYRLMRIVSKGE